LGSLLASRDGIGREPEIGKRRDESELASEELGVLSLSRDLGWFVAFFCVMGLTLSAVLMIIKKCRKREDLIKENAVNWKELEI